jgi:hypothetical protein
LSDEEITLGDNIMGLKFERDSVRLENLELEMEYDESVSPSLRYDRKEYTLGTIDVFTPEAMSTLMQLHPVYVIRKRRKLLVVGGKRTFHAAAFCLRPDEEISIALLDKNTTNDQLNLLRYVDLAVSSLLFRQNSSVADIYRDINLPDLRKECWLPPLATTMQAFADAMGVSSPALCAKSKRQSESKGKDSVAVEASTTDNPA